MNKRTILIIAMVLTLHLSPVMAQNYLFQEGESGFHLQIVYRDVNVSFREYDVELSYTSKGRLTVGVNYDQWNIPGINDSRMHFIGADINYLLLDQNSFPVSITMGTDYTFTRNIVRANEFDDFIFIPDTVYFNQIKIFADVYRRFDLNSKISIIPSLSLGVMQRFISSTREIDENPLLGVLSFKNDVTFNFINIFAGVEFLFNHEIFFYYNFNVGIGFII